MVTMYINESDHENYKNNKPYTVYKNWSAGSVKIPKDYCGEYYDWVDGNLVLNDTDKLTYDNKKISELVLKNRRLEYPSVVKCIEAIMEHLTEDRDDLLLELKVKRALVKAKYPKGK